MARKQQFNGPKWTAPKVHRAPPKEITDHAVLRYLQRVLDLDVEAIRETMLTADQKLLAKQLRDCKLPLGGGHYAKVVGGVVVTIL